MAKREKTIDYEDLLKEEPKPKSPPLRFTKEGEPEVPREWEYTIGNSTFTIWSCGWDDYEGDDEPLKLDGLMNPYGSFKTEDEALKYISRMRCDRAYETGEEMPTVFVIERRTLTFCTLVSPVDGSGPATGRRMIEWFDKEGKP